MPDSPDLSADIALSSSRERAFEFASYIEEMRSGIDSLWERVKDRDTELEELAMRVLTTATKVDSVGSRIAEEARARDAQFVRLFHTAEVLAKRIDDLASRVVHHAGPEGNWRHTEKVHG